MSEGQKFQSGERRKQAKAFGAVTAAPFLRWLARHLPSRRMRAAVWKHVVCPHLWWRRFDFTAQIPLGLSVRGSTADPTQRYLYYFGIWEPNLTAWFKRRLKPRDGFVDVGANVGYFSLLASKLVGEEGSVVAIEPCPGAFRFLQENVKLNSLQNVSALQVAASDHEGELQLYWGDRGTAKATVVSSVAEERHFASSSRVHTLPLSRILSEREIRGARVIKIDFEGHEAEVLLGMVPILDRCRNDLEIAVEMTPSALQQRSTAEVLRPLTS